MRHARCPSEPPTRIGREATFWQAAPDGRASQGHRSSSYLAQGQQSPSRDRENCSERPLEPLPGGSAQCLPPAPRPARVVTSPAAQEAISTPLIQPHRPARTRLRPPRPRPPAPGRRASSRGRGSAPEDPPPPPPWCRCRGRGARVRGLRARGRGSVCGAGSGRREEESGRATHPATRTHPRCGRTPAPGRPRPSRGPEAGAARARLLRGGRGLQVRLGFSRARARERRGRGGGGRRGRTD